MITKVVKNNWHEIRKYRYLIIASAAIFIAIFALLLMQFRAVKRTQEHAQQTMKANLELHLFEISEEAKRKILDHATHIMHGVLKNPKNSRSRHPGEGQGPRPVSTLISQEGLDPGLRRDDEIVN